MNEIVVGVDGSETARRAARKAADLAVACGVGLHLVTTVRKAGATGRQGTGNVRIDSLAAGEQLLASIKLVLPGDPITTSVQTGDPATVLCEEAKRLDARMIVVGNRRVQSAARVLGAIATDVARHAHCDVLIAHTNVDDAGDVTS